ncbi:hypothetical protein AMTRI_Chr06g174280 [Amborella trichopoda]
MELSKLSNRCFGLTLCLLSVYTFAQTPNPRFKAVNLGGWLVVEGWIKPSLFDGIPNKDLLVRYGTQVQFKSVQLGKYLSAENGGGSIIVANRTSASGSETFTLQRTTDVKYQFRVFNGQFIGQGSGKDVVAVANDPGTTETFEIIQNPGDNKRVQIKASNGMFLQSKTGNHVTADFQGDQGWGDNSPAVFVTTIVRTRQGQYQLTNGYGPDKARQIMNDHRKIYIVEDDFRFMSNNGINSMRIPVGWWITSDSTPPDPYVGGSLNALENAFTWAEKYGVKIIVTLHAAPGSQNGNEHSGTRDGSQNWGKTKEYRPDPPSTKNKFLFLIADTPGGRVHYYNLYSSMFNSMTVQQNIDFIYSDRAQQLSSITTANGPLTFVGEWVAEWAVQGASKEDYNRFAKAQLDVYGRASFGWAYWTYKNVNGHWSLKWMIENGYIQL